MQMLVSSKLGFFLAGVCGSALMLSAVVDQAEARKGGSVVKDVTTGSTSGGPGKVGDVKLDGVKAPTTGTVKAPWLRCVRGYVKECSIPSDCGRCVVTCRPTGARC